MSNERGESSPLWRFPIVSTGDPELAESTLAEELVDLRFDKVEGRKQFSFVMNGLRLGDTLIAFNHFGTDTIIDGGEIGGAIVASVGVGTRMVSQIDGESVSYTENIAVFAPPRRAVHHRGAGAGEFTLRIDADALQRRLGTVLDRNPREPIRFDAKVPLESREGRHVQSLIAHLVECAAADESILSNPLIRASYDDLIVSWLLSIPSNYREELCGGRPVSVAPEIVRRAEEYMEARALEPITIDHVVTECGCSRRSLFEAFRKHRGYPPMEFLRNQRLARARVALQLAPSRASVATIAVDCGFTHLGRFASAYHKRFGELPSETLRN